jgi:hypothetical protein
MAHRAGAVIAVLALAIGGPASAQENFDQGKTPAQLYASDCAICHKSPRGLSRAAGMFGMVNFLREHYTVSRQNAASIAAYLQEVDREPAPARSRSTRRQPTGSKLPPARPTATSSETKPADAKPTDAKPADAKPADAKPADAKPADTGGQAQAKAGAKDAAPSKESEPGKKTD